MLLINVHSETNEQHLLPQTWSLNRYRQNLLMDGFDLTLGGMIKIRRKLPPSLAVARPNNGMQ